MSKTASDHMNKARRLRDTINAGKTNLAAPQAWAQVCRQCAIANSKRWDEIGGRVHTRLDNSWFANLDRIWWDARARQESAVRELDTNRAAA